MKNPEVFLKHILDSIIEIEKNTKELNAKEFYRITPIQDAVNGIALSITANVYELTI